MENLSFNPITESDAPTVAEILTDATAIKNANGDIAWGNEGWSTQEVLDYMGESSIYIVSKDDEPVATVSLQWEDSKSWGEQPPIAGYMHRLAVKEDMSGQDLGRQIIGWAETQVATKGRQYLRLDCPADNQKLCEYYESQGFVKVGENSNTGYDNYTCALYQKTVSKPQQT